MANTTGGNKVFITPWTTSRFLRIPAAIPGSSITYYAGQAVGRDASGNMTQMDDTLKAEFIGILVDIVRTTVDPTDQVQVNGLVGDKEFDIAQPQAFMALIASAAAGDEGRKVYWKFNNEVSYVPGTNGNLAGIVQFVKDSTHVLVLPPWMMADFNGSRCVLTLGPAVTAYTMTKFDSGKAINTQATVPQSIFLPPLATMGNGDVITFVATGAANAQVSLKPALGMADTINGAASLLMGLAQYSRAQLMADTVNGLWLQIG